MSLCDLAGAPGAGSIEVADPALIAELVDVAWLYVNPRRGDALHDMGPRWLGQPRRIIFEGRASEDRIFKRPFLLAYGARTRPSTRVCRSLKVAQDG